MPEFLTQSQYARHCGVSRQVVNKAVYRGRIKLVNGMVDVEAADREWRAGILPTLGIQAAEARAEGGRKGVVPGVPGDYIRGFLIANAAPIAGRLKGVTRPADVRRVLREAMNELADELHGMGVPLCEQMDSQ